VHYDDLSRNERIRGGLDGLLIGDALGVPYEFHDASDIPLFHEIEMEPPTRFNRAHKGVPIGTWSDDGAQALCLVESLVHDPKLNLDDLGRRLLAWYEKGYLTPDGRVFDVGIQTSEAMRAMQLGVEASNAGPKRERANGNGALMRCLPVVFFTRGEDDVIDLAMRQGLVTHGHARSQLCCALYALTASYVLEGGQVKDCLQKAEAELVRRFSRGDFDAELGLILDAKDGPFRGSGYVVDCLWSAMDCLLTTSNYGDCVRKAISLGNDTDTTACVAGGIAGLLYGYRDIPNHWLDALKGKSIIEALMNQLEQLGLTH
jgi:ADP-ribosyl-[dinitrogen reductase] hydrolase